MQQGSFQSPKDNNTQTQANSGTFQYPQAYNTQTQMNTGQFQQSSFGDLYPYSQMPPPPPPMQSHKGLIIALLCISCIAIIFGGVFIATFYQHNQKSPTDTIPATMPTSEQTTNQNYTASDILHDLSAAGIHPKFVEYNTTIWSWTEDTYTVSANATSSVNFADDSTCSGYCSPANVGIWVYDNPTTAMQAFNEVLNDEHQPNASIPMMGIPTPTLHGRCLLLSNSDQPIYGQVVMQDCI